MRTTNGGVLQPVQKLCAAFIDFNGSVDLLGYEAGDLRLGKVLSSLLSHPCIDAFGLDQGLHE